MIKSFSLGRSPTGKVSSPLNLSSGFGRIKDFIAQLRGASKTPELHGAKAAAGLPSFLPINSHCTDVSETGHSGFFLLPQ